MIWRSVRCRKAASWTPCHDAGRAVIDRLCLPSRLPLVVVAPCPPRPDGALVDDDQWQPMSHRNEQTEFARDGKRGTALAFVIALAISAPSVGDFGYT